MGTRIFILRIGMRLWGGGADQFGADGVYAIVSAGCDTSVEGHAGGAFGRARPLRQEGGGGVYARELFGWWNGVRAVRGLLGSGWSQRGRL
jgi:hypothetical protein